MDKVLDGIRVLDFGRYIAGPFCATLLGDFGAEVIRVESVKGSADRYTSPLTPAGDGALFMMVGRNKRGMTLAPMKPEGQEIVRALVKTADVVVANLPPPTLKAMGIDHATLKALKPDIIVTTATAFGTTGPYAGRLGFDAVAQAMSGAMHLNGRPDEPMRSVATYVDFGTAVFLALGTLAALMERGKSGRGQAVEGSLLATALTYINTMTIEQGVIAPDRAALGNRSPLAGPGDTFRTRDGWIFVMTVGGALYRRWAELMGEKIWLDDPRFADDQSRGDNGAVLSERMALWCGERTTDEALAQLEAARVPAGPVLTPQQSIDDPQVRAAGLLKDTDYPGLPRPAPIADMPLRLSETPPGIQTRAPTLGEHTDAILEELGYSPEKIAAFRKSGVI